METPLEHLFHSKPDPVVDTSVQQSGVNLGVDTLWAASMWDSLTGAELGMDLFLAPGTRDSDLFPAMASRPVLPSGSSGLGATP
jgi:hypothetical protein